MEKEKLVMVISGMRLLANCGNLKASFELDLGDFVVRECKLIEGPRGMFVGMPSREFMVGGEKRYKNIVLVKEESGLRDELNNLAIEAYRVVLGEGPRGPVGHSGDGPGNDIPF